MKIKHVFLGALWVLIVSCTQNTKKTSEEVPDEATQEENVTTQVEDVNIDLTADDSAYIQSIKQDLKGIEKFLVMDSYGIFLSLLEFKNDSVKYAEAIQILKKKDPPFRSIQIKVLDMKNGYARFEQMLADAFITMTYWNLQDGSKLIATELMSCGPFCESDIYFKKYKDGTYEELDNKEIIPEIENLIDILYPGYDLEDPVEFKFVLPQGGKNIKYCMGDDCLVLEWQNGIFEVKKE